MKIPVSTLLHTPFKKDTESFLQTYPVLKPVFISPSNEMYFHGREVLTLFLEGEIFLSGTLEYCEEKRLTDSFVLVSKYDGWTFQRAITIYGTVLEGKLVELNLTVFESRLFEDTTTFYLIFTPKVTYFQGKGVDSIEEGRDYVGRFDREEKKAYLVPEMNIPISWFTCQKIVEEG